MQRRGATLPTTLFACAVACVIACACSHAALRDPPLSHRPEAAPCVAHPTAGDAGSLDACTRDSDCAAASVCACFKANNAHSTGNVCSAPGNCRIDADCANGQVCSASYASTCALPFSVTYACHTKDDDCFNDSECTSTAATSISKLCSFDASRSKWSCIAYGCEG